MDFKGKISPYLIQYYKMDDKTRYEIEEIDPKELLITKRIDLGAKLYYIDSVVNGENKELANSLYARHIEAFSDGVLDRAKRVANAGIEWYFEKFNRLISVFQQEDYDMDKEYVPVDKNGVLMDGAHRSCCGIYFGKKIKVIRFLDIEYKCHDMWYFRKRGLEEGYLQLMAYTITRYKQGAAMKSMDGHLKKEELLKKLAAKQYDLLYMQYTGKGSNAKTECIVYSSNTDSDSKANQKIREMLKIQQKEVKRSINVSFDEKWRCRKIRFARKRYKKAQILVKKLLKRNI